MRSGTEFVREIQLTDWSTAGNLLNQFSGVQIPRDICTCFKRYLYSMKCSWIIRDQTTFCVLWWPFWIFNMRTRSASARSGSDRSLKTKSDKGWNLWPASKPVTLNKLRKLYLSLPYNKHLINRAKSVCMGESWPQSCVQTSLRSVCTYDLS